MKVIFIGGLTNGELVVDYLIKLKKTDLKLVITHPKNYKIQSYRNFLKFDKKTEVFRTLNTSDIYKKIKKINPDLIIVSGWSWIIPKKILMIPQIGVLGFHPSDLPKDRGRSVLAWQIEEGYTQTALTLFMMKEGVDSGDIVGKKKTHDFKETRERSPIKKLAGIDDFRLIKDGGAPTEEEKALKDTKDYIVGGVKMNIQDIKAIKNLEAPSSPQADATVVTSGSKKKGGHSKSKKGLVDGMTSNAYGTFMK